MKGREGEGERRVNAGEYGIREGKEKVYKEELMKGKTILKCSL